jgi:predicted phosphodiesterase
MALYGVVADIHGNCEALAVVLEALARRGVERLLCLGDLVGYNADPDECVAMIRNRGALAIAGNHDLIALGRLDLRRSSNKAAYALRHTRRGVSRDTRAYLATLAPHRVLEGDIVLVHGGVRDVQQYMVSPRLIQENAALLREDFPGARLCFFGHSHEQKIYRVRGEEVEELPYQSCSVLEREALHFVNPGSVDASRKRADKLAECAILDTGAMTLEFLRMPYDAAATEAKAAAFGYRISPWLERVYRLRKFIRLGWRTASAR